MKAYHYFRYSTQVWITSLVVSPGLLMVFFLLEDHFHLSRDMWGGAGFMVAAILYGGFFSVPNWLLLTGGVAFIDRLRWSVTAKRLLIQLWAAVLTFGLFGLLFARDNWLDGEGLLLPLTYLLTISFGVWNYSFQPHPEEFILDNN